MEMPPLACDCHMHVFGSPDRYPPVPGAAYRPREMGLDAYLRLAGKLGLQRTVFVQPSAYGADNRCMLEAMQALGAGRCRGVAVIGEETSRQELERLHAGGVRGVRLNLRSRGGDQADELAAVLPRMADRLAPFDWHVQIFASLAVLVRASAALRDCPVPVVLDHLGSARAEKGLDQPGMNELLALVARGNLWIKLCGAYRVSDLEPDFADVLPIMSAFVAANPARMVWGTDWPHVGPHAGPVAAGELPPVVYRDISVRTLLGQLRTAAGDDATFRRILVDNPRTLYGFSDQDEWCGVG